MYFVYIDAQDIGWGKRQSHWLLSKGGVGLSIRLGVGLGIKFGSVLEHCKYFEC